MATRKEVKNRISSVKNIHKITRAMEMVAAARLRRAEQRIDAPAPLRAGDPQDDPAGRRGRRGPMPRVPVLEERERSEKVGDPAGHRRPRPRRRLQHPDHPRRDLQLKREFEGEGNEVVFSVVGRRGDSALSFRGEDVERVLHRLHRPPRLRQRARDRRGPDRRLHRRGARPRRADLQPLRLAADPVRAAPDPAAAAAGRGLRRGHRPSPEEPEDPSSPRRTRRRSGSTSPSPRSCSRSCSPSTWTSPSSGRCSSRPPPSTARG